MTSIIPGYEYDIFISYRQKDNKGDRWVSEFVDALKTELESTFKEEISVYFDINPHDGLLETHDVDASLKDKLKCLVFIPIVSRTYCDSKCFAWEHEFKAFVEQASQDKFGLKVKLPNGNVANRVLPVRIHDLDNEDIKLCESVLGGVLRGVEFIYKESGFNRPLKPDNDEKINLNKTKYRNQTTKVALAIKEIILGLKTIPITQVEEKTLHKELLEEIKKEERSNEQVKLTKLTKRKLLSGSIIIAVVIIIVLLYPKIFNKDKFKNLKDKSGRISIAVMPFQNMTNDTIWNVWQEGIQNELINNLTNSGELKVRPIESITGLLQTKGLTNYASITPSVASTISQKLDANVFIYGSIKLAGATLRVNAQLIDSKTAEAFKSFPIDGTPENILHIIDSLSVMVKNFLIISILEKGVTLEMRNILSTNSAEAYRYFIYGNTAFNKKDYPTAVNMFSQAIAIDSNYAFATIMLSLSYGNQYLYDQAKKWCLKAYKKRDQMPVQYKIWTNWVHAYYFETPYEEIKYLKQLQEFDDQSPLVSFQFGETYNRIYQYYSAIPILEKNLEIYKKWGSKPSWGDDYVILGSVYHKTGQYKKEKTLYKKAEQDFPDDPDLVHWQAVLSLTEGDTNGANQYIEKYISVCKDNSDPEANIMTNLASVYSESGILNKAEEYYRKALSLEPEKPDRLNNLAYFLIDKNRNINEGLKLIDKALGLSPDGYNLVHTKGWGLYKQGKYKEALELLEKSWDLKPMYDHEIYLHIQEVKKAIANKNIN
jgi:tetratricopeptide (TPR) repeat protein